MGPVQRLLRPEQSPQPTQSAEHTPSVTLQRHVPLLLLALALSAAVYARYAISPLQEAIRTALSLTDNQIGVLQGPAFALPLVIAAVPIGFMVDRWSRVRLLFLFAAITALGTVITALASSFAMLLVARCIVGLSAAAIPIAVLSLLGDLYPVAQRGRATMVVVMGEIGGGSAVFALGGALLGIYGSEPDAWQWSMIWLAAPIVLVMLLLMLMREPARADRMIARPSTRTAVVELWQYRAVIAPLLAGKIIVGLVVSAILVWAGPALLRTFALSPSHAGAIVATVLLIGGLAGPVIGGVLADMCQRSGGPRRTMLAVSLLALLSTPMSLFALAPDVPSAFLMLIALKTAFGAIAVMETTLATVVIPNELRGLCTSLLIGATVIFGVGVSPVLVSLISGALGGPSMLGKALTLIWAIASVAAAAIFAFGSRLFRPGALQPANR